MIRTLASALLFLCAFSVLAPETPAQQSPTGVTGYTYDTSFEPNGDPGVGLYVEFDDIYYFDTFEIREYFQCGEDVPTSEDPGYFLGATAGVTGPATYSLPFDPRHGMYWAPFLGWLHARLVQRRVRRGRDQLLVLLRMGTGDLTPSRPKTGTRAALESRALFFPRSGDAGL